MIKNFFRYWLPVAFVAAGIFWLSSLRGSQIPHFNIPYIDKMAHLMVYTILGFMFCRAITMKWRTQPEDVERQSAILMTVFFVFLYGISDEYHQSFVAGRSVEFLDLLADMIGGCMGASLSLFYRQKVAAVLYSKKTSR